MKTSSFTKLGSALLDLGRSKEAGKEFQAELKIYPGRFRGMYGAAVAAEQAGDKQAAQQLYAKLAAQTAKAETSREELKRIRDSNRVASSD